MAGHSKWSNIKHRKRGQDAKRAKIFTKIIRELTVAARESSGNLEDNPGLRAVSEKAKAAGMPKDTMERAIARGAGGQEGGDLDAVTYEGYGPGGVAVLVEAMTDNRNRTVAEVRHAFARAGGNLGTDGSVSYLFEKKGLVRFVAGTDEEAVMEIGVEEGAQDIVVDEEGNIEVVMAPADFPGVRDALVAAGLEPQASEVSMIARDYTNLDAGPGEKVLKLLEMLEDIDDVTDVHTNAAFPGQQP